MLYKKISLVYDALHDLVSFMQFKKRQKHLSMSLLKPATVLKVTLLHGYFSRSWYWTAKRVIYFQNKRLELFSKLQVAITHLWEELEVEPTTDIEQQLCQSDAEEAFVLSTQKLDELTRLQQKVINYYVSLQSFKFFFINFKTRIGYVMWTCYLW